MRFLRLVLAATLVTTAACSDGGSDPGLSIVATTTVLGDVVSNVAGDDATVIVLTPVGVDPHDFQASSAQVAEINRADLVVANGLDLEEGLHDTLEAAASDGIRVLEIGPLLDPLPFGGGDSDHGGFDPHVWLDPVRMADAALLIADEMAAIAPDTDWGTRADEYVTALTTLHREITEVLSTVREDGRRLVTNHDSMGYFADRYGFTVVGTVIPGGSTLADASSDALAELLHVIEREGVPAIFAETTQPAALAETLASELGEGVEVVALYTGSLGEPGSGADTLIDMLRTNAGRIATVLGE